MHEYAVVVGVDKSAHRLASAIARNAGWPPNAVVVRADYLHLWRLAVAAGWSLGAHYLLYPNPWPKRRHLARRPYAHPAWPSLVALGGRLHVRANIAWYVRDVAARLARDGYDADVEVLVSERDPLTPFERKYRARGDEILSLTAALTTPRETL